MGRHISPEAGRANMAFMELLKALCKVHTHFCPLLMLKPFQFLGII
jgi:hypothetical protein